MGLFHTIRGWFGGKSHLGAAAPGKPVKPIPYPKGKKTTGIAHHGKVLRGARQTLGASQAKLKKAAQALVRAPLHAAPRAHVGVAAVSPVVKAAQAKHAQAVTKANGASKALATMLLAGKAAQARLARAMISQKKLAVAMRRPRGASHIGMARLSSALSENPEMSLAEVAEVIGFDAGGIPPGEPGYDASTEDGYGDGSQGGPDTGGDPMGGLSDGSLGDQIDNGQVSFPAPPDMSHGYPDMTAIGGIAYDGSKGFPDGFAGSLGLFTRATDRNIAASTPDIDGNEHHGFVFGQYDWKSPALSGFGKDMGGTNRQPGGGIPWGSSLRSSAWNWVHGRHVLGSEDWHSDIPDPAFIFSSPFDQYADPQYTKAYGMPFGPIVGNPAMADFQSMRCDAKGNFFWLPQDAPDWLTFPLKQAAALTAKAAQDAAQAAKAATQAAVAKIQADAAVAAAQQAAELAAAQSASAVQSAQAEGQAAQVLVQQGQQNLADQAAQSAQDQQAGALLLQLAQQQMAEPSNNRAPQGQETGVDETQIPGLGPEDRTAAEMDEQGVPDESASVSPELDEMA